MSEPVVETRRFEFTAANFINDPDLFRRIQYAWENKQWLSLFGEQPDGAVMANMETNEKGELTRLTLYYRKTYVEQGTP